MKNRPRLLALLALLLVIAFNFGCTVVKDELPIPQPEPEEKPLSGELWIGERQIVYTEYKQEWVPVEELEQTFSFYSLYDVTMNKLILVQGNQLHVLDVDEAKGIKLIDQSIEVNPEIFMTSLGYSIKSGAHGRIIAAIDKEGLSAFEKWHVTYKEERVWLAPGEYVVPQEVTDQGAGPWRLIFDAKGNLLWANEQDIVPNGTSDIPSQMDSGVLDHSWAVSTELPLVMAWDLNGNATDRLLDPVIDIVIPKWLNLLDGDGNINDLFRPKYTENVQKQGAKLWVMVNNSFDPDLTSTMLNNYTSRENFIQAMVDYCIKNGLDGMCLDFENMYLKDSDAFVQFVAELNLAMQSHKIKLMVAVTTPGGSENWSLVYDRSRIAEVSHYTAIMAYDQYWASSPVSGPVAGYKWVRDHMVNLAKQIPPRKMVLGVPSYTRVWYERPSTTAVNAMKVKSRSLYMTGIYNILNKRDEGQLSTVKLWDDVHQMHYYAFIEDDALVKFWFEDESALIKKASLVKDQGLAGVAVWSLGFETPQTWPAIQSLVDGWK